MGFIPTQDPGPEVLLRAADPPHRENERRHTPGRLVHGLLQHRQISRVPRVDGQVRLVERSVVFRGQLPDQPVGVPEVGAAGVRKTATRCGMFPSVPRRRAGGRCCVCPALTILTALPPAAGCVGCAEFSGVETGGKGKGFRQIRGLESGLVESDDLGWVPGTVAAKPATVSKSLGGEKKLNLQDDSAG